MKALFKEGFSAFIVRHSIFDKLSYILKSKNAGSKIWNTILSKINNKIKYTGKLPYYPTQVSLEPTTACNYRCPACCHGMDEGIEFLSKRDKHVDIDKFKELIDAIHKKTWYLSLTGCGEGFFHPQLFEMIDYAVEKGMFVTLESNGSILDAEKLAASNISHVHFALDCTSQEAYSKYRVGGNINNVLKRVTKFCDLNQKREKPIQVHLRFLINNYTEEDYGKAASLFQKYDFVTLYQDCFTIPPEGYKMLSTMPCTTTVEKYNEWRPKKLTEYDQYQLDEKSGLMKNKALFHEFKGNCPSVYSGAYINSDGSMTPCCEAYAFIPSELYYGNVFEEGFEKAWNSKRAKTFRKRFKKNQGNYALCSNCPNSRI